MLPQRRSAKRPRHKRERERESTDHMKDQLKRINESLLRLRAALALFPRSPSCPSGDPAKLRTPVRHYMMLRLTFNRLNFSLTRFGGGHACVAPTLQSVCLGRCSTSSSRAESCPLRHPAHWYTQPHVASIVFFDADRLLSLPGRVHIGNYFGAVRPWVKMQHDAKTFISVVDLHSLTSGISGPELRKATLHMAATLLAAGLGKTSLRLEELLLYWLHRC